MKKAIVTLLLSLLLVLLAACGNSGPDIETNMSKDIPEFTYTSQEDEDFGSADLEGKWWVADFVFTNCTTACIPMTSNMALLQDMTKEEGIVDGLHFVSFSVDPDYDTPEVLTEYAEDYDVDLENWTFLTGYDFETIKEFSIKNFQNMVNEPIGDDQVIHGTKFFLVNPEGEAVKSYDGMSGQEMDLILEDLQEIFKD